MKLLFDYLPGQRSNFAGYATKLIILAVDLAMAFISFLLAMLLTDNFELTRLGVFLVGIAPAILMAMRAVSFYLFKTYLIIIRYVGIKDARNVFLAVTASSAAFALAFFLYPKMLPSRGGWAIILVDYALLLLFSGGFRVVLRFVSDNIRERTGRASRINTAIFGAGEMGALLQQVLKQNLDHEYRVTAFFDDNPKVHKKQLNGVPIYNPDKGFADIARKLDLKVAIIAIGQLPEERRVSFIDLCLQHRIKVLKVPATENWLNNNLEVGQLRNIRFEDLLNRPPIQLDKQAISSSISGKTVLVTGCAGSIGKEIVRQCLKFDPGLVIGADIAETPLAEMGLSMKPYLDSGRLQLSVADVRDVRRVQHLFEAFSPDYVFHAAAYKHVPIMEAFPAEAVKTNVRGTCNLAQMASRYGAEKFVMVSTDKAVNPSNVMGASKRIAEIFVQALNYERGNRTQFITTRFGNVLGSNGSVIPIFRRQIEKRKPVTVTHPEITRFFMTIPEACQLVLEAGAMGQGGEIFIFDMGEPVRIVELAEKMIQLSGLIPYQDIDIIFTGLRPGEKLYEELLDKDEDNMPTHHPKIKKAAVRHCDYGAVSHPIQTLINTACSQDADHESIVALMKQLVPEYISLNSTYSSLDAKEVK